MNTMPYILLGIELLGVLFYYLEFRVNGITKSFLGLMGINSVEDIWWVNPLLILKNPI